MANHFFKVPGLRAKQDHLFIHYGIQRTGSSSIRALIRQYCNLFGIPWQKFNPKEDKISSTCQYLLLESPSPAHLKWHGSYHYFITLREPMSWLRSLHQWMKETEGIKLNFNQFVEQMPDSTNYMARFLYHLHDQSFNDTNEQIPKFLGNQNGFFDTISELELFEKVLILMRDERFIFGTLENLIEFQFALLETCAWVIMPTSARVNFSVKSRHKEELSPENLEKAQKAMLVDYQIYETLLEVMKSQYEKIRQKYEKHIRIYKHAAQEYDFAMVRNMGLDLKDGDIVASKENTPKDPFILNVDPRLKSLFVSAEDFTNYLDSVSPALLDLDLKNH